MRNFENVLVNMCIIHKLLKLINAVPPDYCLQILNSSDCHEPPAYVFSYYKPGSRCEMEEWRGCPTANRFDSEEDCVNTCIYHFGGGASNDIVLSGVDSDYNLNSKTELCKEPLRIDRCTGIFTLAFVYKKDENKCAPITWYGCPHVGNVFEEELDCLQTCYQGDLNWDEIMKRMPVKLKDEIESILDNVIIDKNEKITKQAIKATTKAKESITQKKILQSKDVTLAYKPIDTKNNIAKEKKVFYTTTKKVITNEMKNDKIEVSKNGDYTKSIQDTKETLIKNISIEGTTDNVNTVSFPPTQSIEAIKQETTAFKEHFTELKTVPTTRLTTAATTTTTPFTATPKVTSQSTTTTTVTSTRKKKRTTPIQIGTAKAVVLIQDV